MEPDVVEIAPPVASCSRTLTPETAVTQEVIAVDNKNNNVDNKNKGKAIQFGSLSYDEPLAGSSNGKSNDIGSSPVSNTLLDPDSLTYEDDYEYPDFEWEDETDDYSMYQDLYDSKDIPTGVELSMAWFPESSAKETADSSEASKPEATPSSSSLNKKTQGNGILQTQNVFSTMASPIFPPWNPPNNSQGVIPSPYAYPLPQINQAFQFPPTQVQSMMANSPHFHQLQTPVMWDFPGTPPGFPGAKNEPGFKSYNRYRPVVEELLSAPPDSSRVKRNVEDFLGSYLFFKRFDIVEDYSGHHFAASGSTTKPYTKDWAKRIQEEWKMLENDLPEMIFVRAYESRMDLLRAVIIGAEGTPYHDGLFFFDIFFPDRYPSVPPSVHYHAGGLRLNPNLYASGKVCLSLLGTWSGSQREQWIPDSSTMLQVLVSIQGLILNQKPYFNEPGCEAVAGTPMGESASKNYSENAFVYSLKTMVYSIRKPPKYFEEFTYGHFFSCAHDLLKACNAYRNGAPVGSVVKGGVEDVEESSESCSKKFRRDVGTFVDTLLVKELILLGVVGLEDEDEEDKPSETNVAESSSKRSNSKKGRVSLN